MVIDEAHSVAQDGLNFHQEFVLAMKMLNKLFNNQQTPCNCIAMSVMLQKADQDVITNLLERPPDRVIWHELDCQGIKFNVIGSGCPMLLITQIVMQDYMYPTNTKTLVYTHSKA
jgi:hypothetical protein